MKVFFCLILFFGLCVFPDTISDARKSREKRNVSIIISQIVHIIPKAAGLFKEVIDLWNVLLREPNLDIKDAIFRSKEHETIGRLVVISSKLSGLESGLKRNAEATVLTILQAFPKIIKLELNFHDLELILKQINFAHEQLQKYLVLGYENKATEQTSSFMKFDSLLNENDGFNNLNNNFSVYKDMTKEIAEGDANSKPMAAELTLVDFATWATGHNFNSLLSLLRRLNDLVAAADDQGIFSQIKEVSEETNANLCNLKQSPHQTLYNLYNTIAVAELKGNTILQFSYMLLKLYNKGNFFEEAKLALGTYEEYAKAKLAAAKNILSDADRTIYRCDPKQYVEDVTYTKLTKLLQGYIENEVNLNPYGTCRENCAYYTYTEYNGCYQNQFCAQQYPCSGKVVECRYVDSDMNICTSSNPERRYDWIEYENGKVLGSKGVCEKKNLFKVDSWWRYLFWHCSYCLCTCDDSNGGSERFFNLKDVTSDIKNNKIVTGVRIVKHNKIIHLQIQQGVLAPLGTVDKTSLLWKPVDNYTIDDDHVRNNVDYFTMSWVERAVNTDEVFGPPEHVVTGLRFRKIGSHLNLEVRVTPINFTTGELYKEPQSYWIGNYNTEASNNNPRTEIILNDPDIPIRHGPHSLNSKHDQYILFRSSSFDTDAGQSTVPYLDTQALTSQGFPLSGIGLIHRGKMGSGGFIAPKLITYDYTPHLLFQQTD